MISWLLRRNYHRWDKYIGWLQWKDDVLYPNSDAQYRNSVKLHRATLILLFVTIVILLITALTLVLTVLQFVWPEIPETTLPEP